MLTREQILQADDLTKELVHCPEWGGDVYVRTLTGEERDRFEGDMLLDPEEDQRTRFANLRARLAVLALCDEKGMPLFFLHDLEALGKKSSIALDRVFDVARKLSGMRQEDVETLTKNFVAVPDAASGSASP